MMVLAFALNLWECSSTVPILVEHIFALGSPSKIVCPHIGRIPIPVGYFMKWRRRRTMKRSTDQLMHLAFLGARGAAELYDWIPLGVPRLYYCSFLRNSIVVQVALNYAFDATERGNSILLETLYHSPFFLFHRRHCSRLRPCLQARILSRMNALTKHLKRAAKASWEGLSDAERFARAQHASQQRWKNKKPVICDKCNGQYRTVRLLAEHRRGCAGNHK